MSDAPHPLAAQSLTPAEKLSRLFMFLEAQFGEHAIQPIAEPKLPEGTVADKEDTVAVEKAQAAELARLHALGIPVPGLLITVDKSVAKVWLEGLEVECANRSLGERVRAVCERGVEVLSDVVF
jgi:cleavage and polyadenylation specificity factor subunit 3